MRSHVCRGSEQSLKVHPSEAGPSVGAEVAVLVSSLNATLISSSLQHCEHDMETRQALWKFTTLRLNSRLNAHTAPNAHNRLSPHTRLLCLTISLLLANGYLVLCRLS